MGVVKINYADEEMFDRTIASARLFHAVERIRRKHCCKQTNQNQRNINSVLRM